MGDFNAKISLIDTEVVHDSPNGALLLEFINNYSLKVLNFNVISTGKWTRVETKKDIVERSVLDYVIPENVCPRTLIYSALMKRKL